VNITTSTTKGQGYIRIYLPTNVCYKYLLTKHPSNATFLTGSISGIEKNILGRKLLGGKKYGSTGTLSGEPGTMMLATTKKSFIPGDTKKDNIKCGL
jgi:hypothetical protein